MKKSILNGKLILAVDDEPNVLTILEKEILAAAPNCYFYKATDYRKATELLASLTYNLVILDTMGGRGFDLLDLAVNRGLPVVMLTAHALNPETLKRSFEMKARTYLPKEKLGEIVPFLEDIIEETDISSGWARTMNRLGDYLARRWGEDWRKSNAKFFQNFDNTIGHIKL